MLTRAVLATSLLVSSALAADQIGHLPHIGVDVAHKQLRIECAALHCPAPLEFFVVVKGTNEHESVLRTEAKPSDLHAALLMLGLTPGAPVKFSQTTQKWFPPSGPPLNVSVEFDKDGKHVSLPAYKLMRDVRTKQSMPPQEWIFTGSRVMPDGVYAADLTGYFVSIVNFELTPIDVPQLASSANETLEWEADNDALPALGSPVTLLIEPAGGAVQVAAAPEAATQRAAPSLGNDDLKSLQDRWNREVGPHAGELRNAAQTQFQIIAELHRRQQKLIEQADDIQRMIDDLEKQYQQMTTPAPATQP